MTTAGSESQVFERDLEQVFLTLRQALIELFASVDADPMRPYPVATKLGVNKNLTWKASRVIQADDARSAVRQLPGPIGMKTLVDGFRRKGASPEALARVEEAEERLARFVEVHSGDRKTLELILDGLDASAALEESRRQAFRANSAIFGVQVKTRLCLYALSPDPAGSPNTHLTLINSFRQGMRLRSHASAPLLHRRALVRDAAAQPGGSTEVLREFSSDPLPEIRTWDGPALKIFELAPGPIGCTGQFELTLLTEDMLPPHERPASEEGVVHFQTDVALPYEHLVFDLLIHRDLGAPEDTPRFDQLARFENHVPPMGPRRDALLIPSSEQVAEYPFASPLATPHLPNYPALLRAALARNGFDPAHYHTYRVTLAYPPMPTTAQLSYHLPAKGG